MAYTISKLIFWPILSIFIKRIKGIENLPKGKFILACNHSSYADAVILMMLVAWHRNKKLRFYATNDKRWRGWWWDYWFNHYGAIRINGSIEKGIKALKKDCVGIFPEGKMTTNGLVQGKGHTGVAVMALKTGLPIVTTGMNTFWWWNRYQKLPSLKRNIRIIITQPKRYKLKCTKKNIEKVHNETMKNIRQNAREANA